MTIVNLKCRPNMYILGFLVHYYLNKNADKKLTLNLMHDQKLSEVYLSIISYEGEALISHKIVLKIHCILTSTSDKLVFYRMF